MVMVMKNKLQKHHKRKVFFIFRNFSFAVIGLLGVGLSIAIPTYISSLKESNISAKATSEKVEENASEDSSEELEQSELLSIR